MKLARAAEIVAAGVEETLSYYAMPSEHWRSIKTNNWFAFRPCTLATSATLAPCSIVNCTI
jgi:hypothetical protein